VACARRSSIFQDALGDSDENKKYFRFSGISRTSPNDLIAVLEREHTAGRSQLSSQRLQKKVAPLLQTGLPLSRKENSSQTPTACLEVSFRRRFCAAISKNILLLVLES
jgi:hypothetical protein